jgi:hypothetical protein
MVGVVAKSAVVLKAEFTRDKTINRLATDTEVDF